MNNSNKMKKNKALKLDKIKITRLNNLSKITGGSTQTETGGLKSLFALCRPKDGGKDDDD